MLQFKCKMCGGTLEIQNGSTVAECAYCGIKQTLPKLDDEKRLSLYDRANNFRCGNEFDKATAIYEQILDEDNTDAETYWLLVLCRYGIEYVEDPISHKRIPTVNRTQYTSIFDDENYKSALQYADSAQRYIYEEEAKAINVDSLLKQAFMFLEDKDWCSANQYCDKVLDINPECAKAYLGKWMAEFNIKNQDDLLKTWVKNCRKNVNFKNALEFPDEQTNNLLKKYLDLYKNYLWVDDIDHSLSHQTIPHEISAIIDKTFCFDKQLASVTIPDGVTYIGREAFRGCSGLTSITIPDSVTTICDFAFEDCSGLTSVTIGNGVTCIGASAFSGCRGLTGITIPDRETCSWGTRTIIENQKIKVGISAGS